MMTLVLGYYAARLLIFHDTESITGKNAKFKDKEKYVMESGKLILFMAAGSFIMAIIMYFNAYVAVNCDCSLVSDLRDSLEENE